MKGKEFTFLTSMALFLPLAGSANSIVPEATNAKYQIEIYTNGPPSVQLQEQINPVFKIRRKIKETLMAFCTYL